MKGRFRKGPPLFAVRPLAKPCLSSGSRLGGYFPAGGGPASGVARRARPQDGRFVLTQELLTYVAIGMLAQLVDGAIGMAYGLLATSVLMANGVPPALASAGVHAAEVGTTGLSGLAHWRLGHVSWPLVRRLAIAGVLGGVGGALVAGHMPTAVLKPLVNLYLLVMGLMVLRRAVKGRCHAPGPGQGGAVALGFGGGFLDAVGGGGWGPLVTSTLIGRGLDPKLAIGSSNAAEFFVATAVAVAFLGTIGISIWPVVAGLVVGGAVAAPFAALATRYMPTHLLMGMVGAAIVLLAASALLRETGLTH